jgi:2,3-bisphosphoglycerate-independent phosphoglycerate mutase
MPVIPPFKERFGLHGASITAVDLVRGLTRLIGWDNIEVEGATGYLDTNYQGKGQAATKALDDHEIVLVHVEATDEAGHGADFRGKIEALEQIDTHIVAPILERLEKEGEDWRIMVLPDHPTPCDVRTHTRDPVPFAIAGKGIESVTDAAFCEEDAEGSDMHISRGSELMEYFLTVR